MLKNILPYVPNHDTYVESFAGGAALFWAKHPSKIEVLNDDNGEVVNFYKVLKNSRELKKLKGMVSATLHSYQAYKDAFVIYSNPHLFNRVQRAWAFWVSCSQGFASKIGSGWGYDKKGKVNKMATSVYNKKELFNDEFYTKRLEKVSIERRDALLVAKSRDSVKTFHYFDPPYVGSDQGHYKGYDDDSFVSLLGLIPKLKGKVLLSSYPHPELAKSAKKYGWYQKSFNLTVSVSNHRKGKVEVLTANYPLVDQSAPGLF